MSEDIYPYYERELVFIRQLSQEFAQRYPAAAGRLLLQPNSSGDPHVERLIESFALLAGRIHHKLDDEFPELTDSLLGVLYPHFLAPIPSMSVVQFVLDPSRDQLPNGFTIPRHSRLRTAPINNLPCRFRTAYPVELWPVTLTSASLQSPPFPRDFDPPRRTASALRLQFECQSQLTFSKLTLEQLRFYLFGEGHVTSGLYELIFNDATQIMFRSLDDAPAQAARPMIRIAPDQCIKQVGFSADEGLLPYPPRSFPGYRLLSEYFTLREKFSFFDLGCWQRVAEAGYGKKLEVIIFLSKANKRLEEWVDANTFRTGCTPIVNLFEQVAEPVALTQRKHEYRVIPDVSQPLGMEVYSVDSVTSTDPTTSVTKSFQPFYSFGHRRRREENQAFWYGSRRPTTIENDRGNELYLNLVDASFLPSLPAESTLVVRTTCTNRDLPTQLQLAGERLFFELEGAAPLAGIRCLRTPTTPLRPPHRRGRYWSLLSHLSLNYLSLSDPEQGRAALQEILRLYDFSDPKAGQQQLAEVTRQIIDGITGLATRRIVGRTRADAGGGFCRGIEVTIEFDEQKYTGVGMYQFACVLDHFLGLYASINSFTQLVGKTSQSESSFKRWPLRAGDQPLL